MRPSPGYTASGKQFRDTEIQWFKVAEASYANFLYYSK
jgi:hypothetical protein